jgi:hypothetical protein
VAGHARQDRVDPALPSAGCALIGQFVSDVAHQAGGVHLAQQRRRLAHRTAPPPKGSIDQAQPAKISADPACGRRRPRRISSTISGISSACGRRRFGHLRLQAFIDQPFMRGVLVDDDDAVAVWAMM